MTIKAFRPAWASVISRVGAAVLLLSLGACVSGPGKESTAGGAWLTTADQAHLLAPQPALDFSTAPGSVDLPVIAVDTHERHQAMVGFGAAITDASAWLIQTKLTAPQRDQLLKELFGREAQGLGLSFTRLTIGASDFSLDHYSLDDAPGGAADPGLAHFSVARPAEAVFPTVRQALTINRELKVMASPWSAPAWMKTTGSLVKGQLKPDAYPVYARFFARYVEEAAQQGVLTDYLSIQNEPDFEPENYPGMRWPAVDRARFLGENLGPEFKRRGVRTQLLDWDHNWDQPEQPLTVLADPNASPFVAGVAWHCYAGDVGAQAKVAQAHPTKDVFFTECSAGGWSGPWKDSFGWLMRNLVIGSTRGGARGVLMWNLALDENHGPHAGGCGDCRGIVTINSQTGAITRNPEYYAFGHASRFVHPGAVRIGSTEIVAGLTSVAFRNPNGRRVLIVFNAGQANQAFLITADGRTASTALSAGAAVTFVW
ncbi:glucosylceramidase [soil metagenome]